MYLCQVCCLSAFMYCCESWHLQNKEQSRISVARNNCFKSIFNCCWRESVTPLQYFCKVLPINYLIHQRKLLYWNKLFTSDNSVLFSLLRLVSQRFVAFGCLYCLSTYVSLQTIKQAVCASSVPFTGLLFIFLCLFSGCICEYDCMCVY